MAYPVVPVSCTILTGGTTPVVGAVVRFKLPAPEEYAGEVISQDVTGTTDAQGKCTIQVFPTVLGRFKTPYLVTVTYTGMTERAMVVVPNRACTLNELILASPTGLIAVSEISIQSAADQAAISTAQAAIATTKAGEASASASTATTAATEAAASASAAAYSAGNNIRGIAAEMAPSNADLGTAARLDQTWYEASVAWDATSIANAAQASTTVAVPGAEIGDYVMASASITTAGLHLWAQITAQDVCTIYLSNLTGAAVDLASATYNVRVMARLPRR